MTTNQTGAANGRTRNSLASQIDRLDDILNGLSNALNESVAEAVKGAVATAVGEAVQAVFTEIITNPALAARLQGALPNATPPRTGEPALQPTGWLGSVGRGIASGCRRVARGVQGTLACIAGAGASLWGGTCRAASWAFQYCRPLALFRSQLLISLAVGVAAGIAAFFAGSWLAGVASGLGAFTLAAALQIGLWLRKAMGGLAAAWD